MQTTNTLIIEAWANLCAGVRDMAERLETSEDKVRQTIGGTVSEEIQKEVREAESLAQEAEQAEKALREMMDGCISRNRIKRLRK